MPIATDFEIQNDRDIRYIGAAHGVSGAGYHTVLAFHEWLRGLADDAAAAGDDFMDMTKPTPSDKSYETIITLINNFNIDATASEHLYQGSIIQDGGNIIYDGIQIVAAEGCHVEIVQNAAIVTNDFWNTIPFGESTKGLNRDLANGISARFMLLVRTGGADTDGRRIICQTREFGYTYSEFKVNGTGRGINVVPLTFASDLNNLTASGTVATWTTIANLSVGYNGIDVTGDLVDEYYYSEWNKDSYTINHFYERMKYLTRRGTAETLYGINGELFRGITHELNMTTPRSGTFSAFEEVTWSGGVGRLYAVNVPAASTKLWIQLMSGVAPTTGQLITGTGSSATGTTTGAPVERTLSFPFCGVSTGSAIIGAYGFGIEALDLSASDKVFDLTNTMRQAPNNVTFSVGGLVYPAEDYVLVGPRGYRFAYDTEAAGTFTVGETLTFTTPAGTAILADLFDMGAWGYMYIGPMLTGVVPVDNSTIAGASATALVNGAVSNEVDMRQMTLNGALTGGAVTSVVVNGTIPADTPATGTIRIKRASGKYTRHPFSVWTGSTFTITSHDFSTDNAPNGSQVWISYIDMAADSASESFTGVYTADRSLFIRVRNGGTSPIKTFETTGLLGSAGGSATAVRTSDA
jgi:hypothetical protein